MPVYPKAPASCPQYGLGSFPSFFTIVKPVCAAVDAPSQRCEVSRISQFVTAMRSPPPSGRSCGHGRLFQQLRVCDRIDAKRHGYLLIVRPPSDLNQAPAAKTRAIPWFGIAQVLAPLVALLCTCGALYLAGVLKPCRLVP